MVEEINLVQVVCIINETKLSKYSLPPPPLFSESGGQKFKRKLYHDLNSHNIGTHVRNFVKKRNNVLCL